MSEIKGRIYFPGLNGLRFLAAFAVIITHVELLKNTLGFKNSWDNIFVFNLGGLGVYFFFVLSGFLITYLLLAEKDAIGTIGIKNFYTRRILRIWPLYYFLTILGFFVFPNIPFFSLPFFSDAFETGYFFKLFSYILILPNLALSAFHPIPHIGQLWSIGVEEQFYLFWPLLVRFSKNIFRTLIIITFSIIIFKAAVLFYGFLFPATEFSLMFKKFVAMNKFECMAIGAMGAYLVYINHRIIKLAYQKTFQWVALLSIPVLMFFSSPGTFQDGNHILFSISFLIIILNVSGNRNSIINLETYLFDWLGKISYGIYMYHMVIIVFVIKMVSIVFNAQAQFSIFENCLVYLFSILLTILISFVSYNFFEKRFIKIKLNFSKIISGDQVKLNRFNNKIQEDKNV